jgi:hypothetical protein
MRLSGMIGVALQPHVTFSHACLHHLVLQKKRVHACKGRTLQLSAFRFLACLGIQRQDAADFYCYKLHLNPKP